ncbi:MULTISPECIES: hypothetical protein [Xanthomonas]|uniref:hypothetical protein n=1 Tax=Xanthomonas TaxID=338 RepID=UPI001ADB7E93|nr:MULTISPECIES: hypothetical protein [Xanthomonas]MBO9879737.1 hypothetical protein [Xanthomonas sp. D-99]MCC8489117.1 hypothetical protein [Xanthomonas citri pv. fuscans]
MTPDLPPHVFIGALVALVLLLYLQKRRGWINGTQFFGYTMLSMACLSALAVYIRLFFSE